MGELTGEPELVGESNGGSWGCGYMGGISEAFERVGWYFGDGLGGGGGVVMVLGGRSWLEEEEESLMREKALVVDW